jgi:hypothetical protein
MSPRTRRYLRRLAVKGVKTFAQTLAGILTAAGTGLLDTDWTGALSAAGMAGVIAVLMNVGDTEPAEPLSGQSSGGRQSAGSSSNG